MVGTKLPRDMCSSNNCQTAKISSLLNAHCSVMSIPKPTESQSTPFRTTMRWAPNSFKLSLNFRISNLKKESTNFCKNLMRKLIKCVKWIRPKVTVPFQRMSMKRSKILKKGWSMGGKSSVPSTMCKEKTTRAWHQTCSKTKTVRQKSVHVLSTSKCIKRSTRARGKQRTQSLYVRH